MAWIYLQESPDSPLPWHRGCDQLPTVKLTASLNMYCFHKWRPERYPSPQFGTMYEVLINQLLEAQPEQSILLPADSPARTSVLQVLVQAWQESEAAFFMKSKDLLANYDPVLCSWKTCQLSLPVVDVKLLKALPCWGMTVDGALYPVDGGKTDLKAKGGFCLPRPKARDYRSGGSPSDIKRHTPDLSTRVIQLGWLSRPQQLNPAFVERLMGYPIGWTELNASVMRLFPIKRGGRLKSCQESEERALNNE